MNLRRRQTLMTVHVDISTRCSARDDGVAFVTTRQNDDETFDEEVHIVETDLALQLLRRTNVFASRFLAGYIDVTLRDPLHPLSLCQALGVQYETTDMSHWIINRESIKSFHDDIRAMAVSFNTTKQCSLIYQKMLRRFSWIRKQNL